MSLDGARREIKKLRRKLVEDERDFRAAAPPLDADGLPNWDGGVPLTIESLMKALGFDADAELSDEERSARARLAPYAEVFQRLEETEKAEVGP